MVYPGRCKLWRGVCEIQSEDLNKEDSLVGTWVGNYGMAV